MITAGSNIALNYDDTAGTLTITGTDTNTFRTVRLTGGNILGGTEVLSFTAGSNISLSESGGEITIATTANNYSISSDLLDEDKPIAEQKFVCISFVSPEKILKKTF